MQVLLAWGLKHDTSVIPKTTKVKNLMSNLEVLKFELPNEDYKALCQIKPQASLVASTFLLEVVSFSCLLILKADLPDEHKVALWDSTLRRALTPDLAAGAHGRWPLLLGQGRTLQDHERPLGR